MDTNHRQTALAEDLRRLAAAYEEEARSLREAAANVEQADEDDLVDSALGFNILDGVMRTFNTSNRIAAAESCIRSAFILGGAR
jgi:hypothetical protein